MKGWSVVSESAPDVSCICKYTWTKEERTQLLHAMELSETVHALSALTIVPSNECIPILVLELAVHVFLEGE
eukprot:1147147-Pelagomonas_calceolata.AAC.3